MLTKVKTATLSGVRGYPVTVETDLHRGMPGFNIVGLADTTIREATQRIKPAIMNCGFRFPNERVTVNLVPAAKPKEGSHFDLPIALGIMMLGEEVLEMENTAFLGEVSLDGRVNPVRGALPLAMSLRSAGIKNIVLPAGNAEEAAILEDVNILPVNHLKEAVDHVSGERRLQIYKRKNNSAGGAIACPDFAQVIGQESVKRAIVIGAAGNHGMLMMGSPGCGKTMMARCIPGILPELTYEEKLEITGIYSVAGLLSDEHPIVQQRPFRSPHHTITQTGLIGGGAKPRPGELSLAHRGVIFLDELGEFDARVIDAMRQPVEEGLIRINRNLEEVIFPSRVMVVIAANPCKCGNLWDERKLCTCTPKQIESHRRKLMGPFADRIDMHIRVNPVDKDRLNELKSGGKWESTDSMRRKVVAARRMQEERYSGLRYSCNGELDEEGIKRYCSLDEESHSMMVSAYERLNLSMRGYNKILKIARTIADLDRKERIEQFHVAEALMFRIDSDMQ
ncbi:MAG: YifB family Mg chelatase-like AAA ATPase [Clostridia bacterium]|nr:YifB family Mg chelatase-like AAA ATPase [Clostridia bacterium]